MSYDLRFIHGSMSQYERLWSKIVASPGGVYEINKRKEAWPVPRIRLNAFGRTNTTIKRQQKKQQQQQSRQQLEPQQQQ